MSKTIVNGVEVHYEVDGSGPWLTLAHALACDLSLWDEFTTALQDRFTILRYDLRGHGASGAPPGPYDFSLFTNDLVGLLDHLKIERTDFLGVSLGGMIGQHFALAAPQRLRRLVIANSTSRIGAEAIPVWQERIRQVETHGMSSLVDSTLARWFTPEFRVARPDIMQRIGRLIAATPPCGYIGCGAALQSMDISAQIAAIRRPTLVLSADQDIGMPMALSSAIAAAIPDARLEVIASASHLACLEQAERFRQTVAEFLLAA